MCGGTILNKRYVLTAMHCLFDQNGQKHPANKVSIIAGEHNVCDDFNGLNEGGQV
jgi:secreted trypsin-like serine protease